MSQKRASSPSRIPTTPLSAEIATFDTLPSSSEAFEETHEIEHELGALQRSLSRPPSPPTYHSASQEGPEGSRPGAKWLTIEWFEDPVEPPFPTFPPADTHPITDSESELGENQEPHSSPQSSTPLESSSSSTTCSPNPEVYSLPMVPELCRAVSNFQQTHVNLQGYAKAIFNATNKLADLKGEMMGIHEFWMEAGMHDMAHDLLPILDIAQESMPRYTFPPTRMVDTFPSSSAFNDFTSALNTISPVM